MKSMYKSFRNKNTSSAAFTVVEMLLVIVVIAILATIVTVAYRGVQERAVNTQLQTDITNIADQLELDYLDNKQYPATTAESNGNKGFNLSPGTNVTYHPWPNGKGYCADVSSSKSGTKKYYIYTDGKMQEGTCADNYNGGPSSVGILVYDKGSISDGWRYLEAAPEDQSTGVAWCNNTTTALGVTNRAIGAGKSNTATMLARCTSGAAVAAHSYQGGGKQDWFLPSAEEFHKLCGLVQLTGDNYNYWVSNEDDATRATRTTSCGGGYSCSCNTKVGPARVRAVRTY